MDLPAHPEADDSNPDQERATTIGGWTKVLVVVAGALVALVVLHLIGIVAPAGG